MKNSIKRITKKSIKEFTEQYNEERFAKKRNVTFFEKKIAEVEKMLAQQKSWVFDKIEKEDFCERFNEIGHDVCDDLQDLIDSIESDCDSRNWNASDWSTYSLMQNNID